MSGHTKSEKKAMSWKGKLKVSDQIDNSSWVTPDKLTFVI